MRARTGFCYRFLSITLAFSLSAIVVSAFLFYGTYKEEPTEYREGDVFAVSMGPLISPRSMVVWPYYWYPFPRGPGFRNARQAFWDAFVSLYSNGDCGFRHVAWEADSPCYAQSTITNDTEMFYDATVLGSFHKAIQDNYRMQPYVDGVRVISERADAGWWWGVPLGYTIGNQVLLYNHVDFHVDVDPLGRVLKAVGVPRHTESLELCGRSSHVPNHPVDVVRWSYRTIVKRTSERRKDMTKIYDSMLSTEESRVGYVMFAFTVTVFVVAGVAVGIILWRICVRNRFDLDDYHSLLQPPSTTLRVEGSGSEVEIELNDKEYRPPRDIDIEVESVVAGSASAKYKLKQFRGPITGRPHFPRTLAVFVASSIQLVVVVFVALLVSIAYQHSWNNMYQVITIILLPTTGAISGFICKRLLVQWRVRTGPLTHFWSVVVLTIPLYIVFFVVTSMQMLYHDGAMIAGLFFVLVALLLLNGVMYGLGVNLAVAFPASVRPRAPLFVPDGTSSVIHQLAVQSTSCLSVALAQGFGAVYIGVLLLTTPWNTRVKQQIWFMWLFMVLWLASGALLAVAATYLNVIYGNYPRWHWVTYTMGALTSVVVFVVSVMYTFSTVTFVDEANNTAVLVYLAVASALVGAVSGAVDWLATYVFFEHFIYRKLVPAD